MGILSNIFDKFSYPKTISLQKSELKGGAISVVSGVNISTKWQYIDYTVSIYAKRNFDNSYNIYLQRHSEIHDYGRTKLDKNISIHKAISRLKEYDRNIDRYYRKAKRYKKKRSHYEKVQARLVKNGVIKH